MIDSEGLRLYTIYERPLDYPTGYVMRPWLVGHLSPVAGPVPEAAVYVSTLEEARAALPPGLVCLQPYSAEVVNGVFIEGDDPTIVETWL